MDCVFCKIVKGELPSHKVYEDDSFLAFLDIHPISAGHTLLIPKEHYTNLLSTPDKFLSDLVMLAKKIGKSILEVTGAAGLVFSTNHGEAAGQSVFHTHFHLIPRDFKDGLPSWPTKTFESTHLEKLASAIKEKNK